MKLTILGRVPSKKNSLRRIKRGNRIFTVASQQYDDWHSGALWQLKLTKAGLCTPSTILLTFYPPDRIKGDLTNKAESIMDTLVDAGILEDDNWTVVGDLQLKFGGVDKLHPRAEIEIL